MATYLITGVSRGLGYEFLRQLSSNPDNTVVGLVRDKAATEAKVTKELGRSNVHVIQGDLTDYKSLQVAADATAKITGGSLDYLIANAAYLPGTRGFSSLKTLASDPEELESQLLENFKTNVVGNVHLINIFLPLILKGKQKKVITLSSGMADDELIRKYDCDFSPAYSVSKAAMNTVTAKFSAAYAGDGVLFLNVCPGMVNTDQMDMSTPEAQQQVMHIFEIFKRYAPHFQGPDTPETAVKAVISVYENASLANGDGGAFLSHFGNKQWL